MTAIPEKMENPRIEHRLNFSYKDCLSAIKLLLNASKCEVKAWTESYKVEDSNQPMEIERNEVISMEPVFKLDLHCRQKIVLDFLRLVSDNKGNMTDEDLEEAADFLSYSDDLIDAGTELDSANRYIGILEELAKRNPSKGQEALRDLYCYGKPEIGIFRNSPKAREYDPDMEPYEPNEDDIRLYQLLIHGNQQQLEGIKKIIDELGEKYRISDIEFGLFLPLAYVMIILVGSGEYSNYIQGVNLQDSTLVIDMECEAFEADALKYALQCSFGKMDIEVKEN